MALKRSKLGFDSPVNNFATLNPLALSSEKSAISDGNLKTTFESSHNGATVTIPFPNSGKWYVELITSSWTNHPVIGIFPTSFSSGNIGGNTGAGTLSHNALYFRAYKGTVVNQDGYSNDSPTFFLLSSGDLWSPNDVLGILVDMDNHSFKFYKNGNLHLPGYDSISLNVKDGNTYALYVKGYDGDFVCNFGQNSTFCERTSGGGRHSDANGRGEFYYKPPWGALALCSANLPAMEEKPSQNFKAVVYDGDGDNSGRKITTGFAPDLIWIKQRTQNGGGWGDHQLYDSVRGPMKVIRSNETNGELDNPSNGGVSSFESDGFEMSGDDASINLNDSNETYVAWAWKAGGAPEGEKNVMIDGVGSTMADSGLDTGDITPTAMSINTKTGFSIVTWTGNGANGTSTVPHGLDRAPEFMITKNLDGHNSSSSYNDWPVYHKDAVYTGSNSFSKNALWLHNTAKAQNDLGGWHHDPTDEVFTPHSTDYSNSNQKTYIAYCWHSVPGYSAFGSYEGNGSTDGPFLFTGFKPAWVMIKCADQGYNNTSWAIYDSARNTSNPVVHPLHADTTAKEGSRNDNSQINASSTAIDFLSNGFKIRNDFTEVNHSSAGTYIYIAFAEKPPTVPEKVKYNTSMKERHSLYFNGSSHLNKTMLSGSRTRFTYSCWFKRSTMDSGTNDILWYASNGVGYALICFTNNQLRFYDVTNNNTGDDNADIRSSHVFRDQSSFVHVVLSVNASEATLDNKVKIYVNGKLNPLDGSSFFNDTVLSTMNTNISTYIGNQSDVFYMNGNLSNVHFIDGAACSADYFGKYENGKWVAKEYESAYGNNGFHLDFAPDNMEYRADGTLEIVKDSSGNGNHWTAST